MKKKYIIAAFIFSILIIAGWWYFGSARMNRIYRDVMTDHLGGADRTVEVYTYDGKLLKTYHGRIDVKDSSSVDGETELLINNDRRVSIINGIVIIEEN